MPLGKEAEHAEVTSVRRVVRARQDHRVGRRFPRAAHDALHPREEQRKRQPRRHQSQSGTNGSKHEPKNAGRLLSRRKGHSPKAAPDALTASRAPGFTHYCVLNRNSTRQCAKIEIRPLVQPVSEAREGSAGGQRNALFAARARRCGGSYGARVPLYRRY
eukprot:scaffold1954_cov268-Pinguiococcus_pyrenoidosus.AAC.184